MLPGKTYSAEEILKIAARRWWLILLPLVLGSAIAVAVYRNMPVQYRSETLIMVIPQRVPDSYVRSTVTGGVEDRLPTINEQIMSRSRLERIITNLNLYPEERRTGIMEDIVARMRADIDPKLEGRGTFRISYKSHDPKLAQQVTERLASLYIEENMRDRESLAENTSMFLESQLTEAKAKLQEQEKKLEAYQKRHAGQLPSQLSANLQSMQSSQMQLQSVGAAINNARERRLVIQRQLVDLETLPVAVVVPDAPTDPDNPNATPEQQLAAARQRLEAYSLRYTKDHPDIKSLERLIVDLQARVDADAKAQGGKPRPTPIPEVARQKRIGDLRAELEIVDRQIAGALKEEERLRTVISQYQSKIDMLPTRESELVELTRDYTTLNQAYTSLLAKREDSKLAANLERKQIGEQFRILDPASLPQRPYNEKQRLTVLFGGMFGSLLLGLGLVAFLEYRDSSFKSEDDVVRVLSLPVLALVPTMAETQAGSRRSWFGISVGVVALVAVGAVAFWLQS